MWGFEIEMLIFSRDFEAFEVRGEGYNNNYTGSGGQRGWEKCDSSIAVFLTQG